jgi:hypothetical protein
MDRVFVAGDPNQAIYGFMGTSPRFMRQALDRADEAVLLEKSFRNAPAVTEAGEAVLRHAGYDAPDVQGTGDGVVRVIGMKEYEALLPEYESESTFHLFRCNYMKSDATNALSSVGIPFKSGSGARWSDKQVDFYNAVAKGHAEVAESAFGTMPTLDALTPPERQRLAEAVHGKHWLAKKTEYPGFEETGDAFSDVVEPRPVLDALGSDNPMSLLESGEGPFVTSMFSDSVAGRLVSTFDTRNGRPIESMDHHVDTIHAAKGREAEAVFLFDSTSKAAEYDDTKYGKGYDGVDADDPAEMRVWYVGLTRSLGDCYVVRGTYSPHQELPL